MSGVLNAESLGSVISGDPSPNCCAVDFSPALVIRSDALVVASSSGDYVAPAPAETAWLNAS